MFICRTRSRIGGPPGDFKGFGCSPRTSKYPREVTVKVFDGTAAVVLSVPRVRLGTRALGIALLPAHFHGSTPIILSLSFGRLLRPPALDEMAPMKLMARGTFAILNIAEKYEGELSQTAGVGSKQLYSRISGGLPPHHNTLQVNNHNCWTYYGTMWGALDG